MIKVNEKERAITLDGTAFDLINELSVIVMTMRKEIPRELIDGAVKTGHEAYEKFKDKLFKEESNG